ncbi:hypothetical protein HAX54_041742 [Datura stramonium]|uniref:Uncharacterized protein n=1 Tax=Datura stramonium TaxID=4076 RepID=A0ABS8SLM7_DATST|nr:hypothetical protein [Datura stramonium]
MPCTRLHPTWAFKIKENFIHYSLEQQQTPPEIDPPPLLTSLSSSLPAKLRDELESDKSSGSEVHYNIETSNEYPVVTTRAKSKAQETEAATASPSQFEEGGDDDSEVEGSGNKDNAAEKFDDQVDDSDLATTPEARSKKWFVQGSGDVYYAGLALNEKGNPNRSTKEEPKIQINALNEVPKLKRLFEGYNMY